MKLMDLYPVAVFVTGMVWMKALDFGQAYYRELRGVDHQ